MSNELCAGGFKGLLLLEVSKGSAGCTQVPHSHRGLGLSWRGGTRSAFLEESIRQACRAVTSSCSSPVAESIILPACSSSECRSEPYMPSTRWPCSKIHQIPGKGKSCGDRFFHPQGGVMIHITGAPSWQQRDYFLSWAGSRVSMKDSASAHLCLVRILSIRT